MARSRRRYSTPVVLTAAALAPYACAGISDDQPDGLSINPPPMTSGGTGGLDSRSETGGNISVNPPFPDSSGGGGSSGGAGPSGGMNPTAGAAGIPSCDLTKLPSELGPPPVACEPGSVCLAAATCPGRSETFTFTCEGESPQWRLLATNCDIPYEQCHFEETFWMYTECDNSSWRFEGGAGNPPAPCPLEQPKPGATCRPGASFGLDPEQCGYACPGGKYSISICTPDGNAAGASSSVFGSTGTWVQSPACNAAGAAGNGGAGGND